MKTILIAGALLLSGCTSRTCSETTPRPIVSMSPVKMIGTDHENGLEIWETVVSTWWAPDHYYSTFVVEYGREAAERKAASFAKSRFSSLEEPR